MKKVLLLLCVWLLLSAQVPVFAVENIPSENGFLDVPESDYYYESICYVVDNGIFKGTSETAFSPDDPMTRAMFVTVLSRIASAQTEIEETDAGLHFLDVQENMWYTQAVRWAVETGIVTGYNDTQFGTNDLITQEQALTIFDRFCEKYDLTLPPSTYTMTYYNTISPYALEAVKRMAFSGIFMGDHGDRTLHPQEPITRAMAAEISSKIIELQKEHLEHIAFQNSLDPESVSEALWALQSTYPEGTKWTNDDYYKWNGGIYNGGYGCAGFAFMLSDAIFGTCPAVVIEENVADFPVRPGDILRINQDRHSVIILETNENGVIIAEGNFNGGMHWGGTLTWDAVKNADYIMTRYGQSNEENAE